METLKDLKIKFNQFADLAEKNITTKPWMVVILIHEFARNMYPTDPFLPFKEDESPTKRMNSVLNKCITIMKDFEFMDSYFAQDINKMNSIVDKYKKDARKKEEQTQKVYGNLWDNFDHKVYTKEAKNIVEQRFKYSNFDFSSLKDKTILDLGCGSGRYTIALALLTNAKMVHGVDLGETSFDNAQKIIEQLNLKNIKFDKGNCLQLPYEDNSFDFVFCNGVLHHTKDMEKGIQEFYRVLKPGCQGFLYLYAEGGLFWHARKRMNILMKKIPQEYSIAILHLLGMPQNRFLFCDNWYVPIERHTTRKYLETYLNNVGFTNLTKIVSGKETDFDSKQIQDEPETEILYGDGEHRYLMTKQH